MRCSHALCHLHDCQRLPIVQRNFLILDCRVSFRSVEGNAAQRCTHFQAREAGFPRRFFASFEDQAADAAPRPVRMYEERSNLGRISRWVEQRVFACRILIAAIQSFALAPSAAAHNPGSVV